MYALHDLEFTLGYLINTFILNMYIYVRFLNRTQNCSLILIIVASFVLNANFTNFVNCHDISLSKSKKSYI
jgi:hypothetical protein